MSSARRPLGTGPTTSTSGTTSPRLLPAERAEYDEHQADVAEHQEVSRPSGRRLLGERGR